MNYNKKPPYSKRLAKLLADPSIKTAGSSVTGKRSIYVIAGTRAWNKAREIESSHAFLVAPPDTDPASYDWSILCGHEPIHIIVEGHSTDLQALAEALNESGVERVLFPAGDGSAIRCLPRSAVEYG